MVKFSYKSFITGKNGESDGRQDSLSCKSDSGLFAVADGVSQSSYPEYLSRALCDVFVNSSPVETDDWQKFLSFQLLPSVSLQWHRKVLAQLKTLEGRALNNAVQRLNRWPDGASTFCGIRIDAQAGKYHYAVIGDSTLFCIPDEGSVKIITTAMRYDDGLESSELNVDYSNSTDAVLSDASYVGRWETGEMALTTGYLLLMTDGAASWFQKRLKQGGNPAESLWNLDNDAQFEALAEAERREGEMDDDLAVVIIRIEYSRDSASPVETLPHNQLDNSNDEQRDEEEQFCEDCEKKDEAEGIVSDNGIVANVLSRIRKWFR